MHNIEIYGDRSVKAGSGCNCLGIVSSDSGNRKLWQLVLAEISTKNTVYEEGDRDARQHEFRIPGNTWPCFSAIHALCLTTRREQLLQDAWSSLPPYVAVKTSD